MDAADVVIVIVILARFGVPLLIPRFPLPAIVVALVLDAVDGTILEWLTGSEPPGYQTYDKALDIFYLSVAYVSTLRNWRNLTAFRASRVIFYLRMVGVAAFEMSGARWLLIVFPNVFEYFFIWYEALRTRWNPLTFSAAHVLTAMAAIWVLIKLPQEWFVHVAQLDFTDTLADHPWLWAVLAAGVVVLELARRRYTRYLGAPDWPATYDVDAHLDRRPLPEKPSAEPIFGWVLVEKIGLASLLSITFLKPLELEASTVELVVAIAIVVIANSAFSHALALRGHSWRWLTLKFLAMSVFNFGVLVFYILVRSSFDAELETGAVFFNVLVFTLILTLFDRYRHMGSALEHRAATRRSASFS